MSWEQREIGLEVFINLIGLDFWAVEPSVYFIVTDFTIFLRYGKQLFGLLSPLSIIITIFDRLMYPIFLIQNNFYFKYFTIYFIYTLIHI